MMKFCWIIAFVNLVSVGCEKSIDDNMDAENGVVAPVEPKKMSVEHDPAMLEIYPQASETALSEPLGLLGVMISPDKKLVLVLDQEAKAKMAEVTSAEGARNSLLTVKLNGVWIDDQRNENGWTGGVVLTGSVSEDVLDALRSKGIKIVEIEHSMFTPYEGYVELLEQAH